MNEEIVKNIYEEIKSDEEIKLIDEKHAKKIIEETLKKNVFIDNRNDIEHLFSLTFISNLQSALKDLTVRDLSVLLTIIKLASFRNVYSIKQVTIAKDTGLNKSDVSKSLKKLKELNYLITDENNDISYVNPYLFFTGSIAQLREMSNKYGYLYCKAENLKSPFEN